MTKTKYLITLIVIFVILKSPLWAQEKELYLCYNFERKVANFGETLQVIEVFAYDGVVVTKKTTTKTGYKYSSTGSKVIINDTINKYVKVDYSKAHLLIPVFDNPFFSHINILLKEPLNLFDWSLCKETKTILGYQCFKAICSFRGREYEAYFTRELPFKAAPWKFHGLPGVILEVYSIDDFYKWSVQSLEIRTHNRDIKLPFDGVKTINIEQYIDLMKEKRKRRIERIKQMKLQFAGNPDVYFAPESKQLSNSIEIFELH